MKEGLIKDAYELVIKEIQTIITISYIVAFGIGMLFNFQKFFIQGNAQSYRNLISYLETGKPSVNY